MATEPDISEFTEEEYKEAAALENPDKEANANDVTFKYDEEYQRELLGAICHDRGFLIDAVALVQPNYFDNDAHKLIAQIVFNYFAKYKTIPTRPQITQEMREQIVAKTDQVKAFYLGELGTVLGFYVPGVETREAYRDKITKFAQMQSLRNAFHACLDDMKKAPDDEATWAKIYERLRETFNVQRNFDIGLDYFQSYKERYERMGQDIVGGEVFTSGFPDIDNALMGGGLTRGEMASWVGLSGTGKSLALVAACLANLHKGKRVLYISLEIDQDGVAERFDAQITDPNNQLGVTINNLFQKKDLVFSALEDYIADKEDQRLLVIKRFPGGQMGMAEFRAYVSQLKLQGFSPDLIIIDYIGEMKDVPGVPTHESRYMITRDLRGFAVEELVCIMTAMQPNRSAKEVVRNGMLIDDDNLGDSYAQIKPLDAMWSINQLQEEKECGLARILVAKHRSGKSRFTIHVQYNYDTLSITQITQEKYENILKKYRLLKETTTTDKMREVLQEKQANDIINGGSSPAKKSKKGSAVLANWDNSDAGYSVDADDGVPPADLKV